VGEKRKKKIRTKRNVGSGKTIISEGVIAMLKEKF